MRLSGMPAYALVALLVGGEAAALVGLVLPGEAALLLGGVLAGAGRVSLPVLLLVATAAAVVGDSVGYAVGRYVGPALRRSRVGTLVGPSRWSRAEVLLERRGGPAVLLGRWVGVLRALVPSLAGTGRMPYGRFLVWNVSGALLWVPTVVLAGDVAGARYRTVERVLGRSGLVVLAVVLVGVGVALAARAVRRSPEARPTWLRRATDLERGLWPVPVAATRPPARPGSVA